MTNTTYTVSTQPWYSSFRQGRRQTSLSSTQIKKAIYFNTQLILNCGHIFVGLSLMTTSLSTQNKWSYPMCAAGFTQVVTGLFGFLVDFS